MLEMRLRLASTAIAVIFLLSTQLISCSADYVPLSIEEMTEAADVILIGTVDEVLHVRTHREVTVSVDVCLKHFVDSANVTVIVEGATFRNKGYGYLASPQSSRSPRGCSSSSRWGYTVSTRYSRLPG